jgi:hypothetical protein
MPGENAERCRGPFGLGPRRARLVHLYPWWNLRVTKFHCNCASPTIHYAPVPVDSRDGLFKALAIRSP